MDYFEKHLLNVCFLQQTVALFYGSILYSIKKGVLVFVLKSRELQTGWLPTSSAHESHKMTWNLKLKSHYVSVSSTWSVSVLLMCSPQYRQSVLPFLITSTTNITEKNFGEALNTEFTCMNSLFLFRVMLKTSYSQSFSINRICLFKAVRFGVIWKMFNEISLKNSRII